MVAEKRKKNDWEGPGAAHEQPANLLRAEKERKIRKTCAQGLGRAHDLSFLPARRTCCLVPAQRTLAVALGAGAGRQRPGGRKESQPGLNKALV